MITAEHVGGGQDGPVTLSDGRVLSVVPGSDIQLSNPANIGAATGAADLRMFELTADPGLPALTVGTTTPTGGQKVMMIGAGLTASPNLVGWSLSAGLTTGTVWTPTQLPLAQATGYNLTSTPQMTWGLNTVQAGGDSIIIPTASTNSVVFTTTYIIHGGAYIAQATTGDSGGGVFSLVNNNWQLTGIMDAVLPLPGQPGGTVVTGDQTYSADLSQYAKEISTVLNSWDNIVNPEDVNRSGTVSPLDALLVINAIQNAGNHPYDFHCTPVPNDLLLDVNGDGMVSPLDCAADYQCLAISNDQLGPGGHCRGPRRDQRRGRSRAFGRRRGDFGPDRALGFSGPPDSPRFFGAPLAGPSANDSCALSGRPCRLTPGSFQAGKGRASLPPGKVVTNGRRGNRAVRGRASLAYRGGNLP